MMKRKTVEMHVTVTVPVNISAGTARREVRELINHGTGSFFPAGECVKARKVAAVAAKARVR